MRVGMLSNLHHDRRGWGDSESTIAISQEHYDAVAVMISDCEIKLAIGVHISERHVSGTVRHSRCISRCGKLSVAFTQHDCNAATFFARQNRSEERRVGKESEGGRTG